MKFLQNTWYMLGWSSELGAAESGRFVYRTICDEPILAYRLHSGAPAAIQDRCAHRFVPLHMGKQVGDTVECGYHGLCFDSTGQCVKNPIEGAPIPKAAKVRAFPLVDRYGVLWVWLGDADKANPDEIADFDFLVDPKRGTVRGHTLTKANYELLIDNLADLTHVQYVHASFQASEVFHKVQSDFTQDGNTITTRLTLPNGPPPPLFEKGLDSKQPIDLVTSVRWNAPSVAKLTLRVFRPGDRSESQKEVQSAHIVSPETATTSHYFYANSRDYAVDDPEVDKQVAEWQRIGFGEQDKPMLEAQQRMLGEQDLMSMKPVLLGTDAGAVRIRRTLAALIQSEVAKARAQ